MKLFPLILLLLLTACITKKEHLIARQEFLKLQMDSVEVYKDATLMLLQEWKSDKNWDSVGNTDNGRAYSRALQSEYEHYDSVFKQFRKQYDELDMEIQKQQ